MERSEECLFLQSGKDYLKQRSMKDLLENPIGFDTVDFQFSITNGT
ncbi:hypothetical protein Lepto7376_4406 [[Leptolyngbya] sp. PCC 7376]|nr:hypothetical protein Lepto7376_4406 [[Leptolyngbya] sp. PCC 7376]